MDFPILPLVAILIIAALEVVAIAQGINGAILAGSLAIIAGLAGYTAGAKRKRK